MKRDKPTAALRRAAGVVAVAGDDTLVIVARGDVTLRLAGAEARLASRALERLETPLGAAALGAELGPGGAAIVDRLFRAGIVVAAEPAAATGAAPPPPCGHLVVAVCGTVQALDITPYLRVLQQSFGKAMDVIVTAGAQRFVRPEALALLGAAVWTDEFEPRGDVRVPHMHLAERAELVLVLPASANALARLAAGACSDLLSLVVAATRAPIVLAPAMNGNMWTHAAVQRNVERLRQDGMLVIEPIRGVAVSSGATGGGGVGVRPAELLAVLAELAKGARAPLTRRKNAAASAPRRRRR